MRLQPKNLIKIFIKVILFNKNLYFYAEIKSTLFTKLLKK
jgi:hypothetical protein